MAIKAFSGGIQNQPLPEINLFNVQDGDILVYKTANKAFENTVGSFTTLDQVNALIANINSGGSIDLSDYATTTSLNTEVTNLTALINSKTDEAYVDAKIAALPGPVDLSDYIDTATFNGALSNYDTSTVIDGKINTAVANATFFDGDYNNLFNTPTIPSLDGYATQLWVQQQINAIPGGGGSATTLSGLTDVDTTNATAGQVLKYDGNSWAPADDSTTGGGGTDADTLDGFDSQYYLDYNNLNNTPAPITPFSGDYNDLTNTPVLFSGDYNDLLNKPAGNADLSLQLVGSDLQLLNIEPDPDTIISSVSLSALGSAIGTSIDYADLQNLPNLFSGDYNDLVNRPNLFSGDYNDLANKPYIPSIAGLASVSYVDSAIQGATTGDKVFEGNISQVAKVSNVVAASQDNYIMAVTTTDATITEVLLTSGNRITIEDDSTVMYDIHVVGADSTEHHGVKIKGIIDRTSGTTSLVGSPAKEILVENDDGWNADVVADTVNGSLKITVQGEASRTVNWTIFVELKTVKR